MMALKGQRFGVRAHILFIRTVINMAAKIVHQPSSRKTEECESEDMCVMKRMIVRFSLTMLTEEDFEMEGHQELSHPQPELEVEDICKEIVVIPEQADFAFISAQIGRLIKEHDNLFLKSHQKCKYITFEQNQIYLADTMSAKITIFQCMATKDTKSGVPVVLNFTGTDNFFCCINEGGEITLKVTRYDKTKLQIPGDDQEKLAHVFYMSQTPDGLRKFESALHRGWFIHTVDGNAVKMQRGKLRCSISFVLIETDSTTTIEY